MTEQNLARNRDIMNNFLVIKEIPKEFRLKEDMIPYGYIYCIENKKNGKKYIGSTHSVWVGISRPTVYCSLHKRASQYIYEYNRDTRMINAFPDLLNTLRPVIRAMVVDGIENFIMYPIAETTRWTHTHAENYFIKLYNSVKNGYNQYKAIPPSNTIGRSLSQEEKLLRSEQIFCININTKQMLYSDSMKLFGDFISSSKDMIKNSVRKGRPYKGWYLFYVDKDKRQYILETNVFGDGLAKDDRHSNKSKASYKEIYDKVSDYISNGAKSIHFSDFELMKPLEYIIDQK